MGVALILVVLACVTLAVALARFFAGSWRRARSDAECPLCAYREPEGMPPRDLERPCPECGRSWLAAEAQNDLRRRLAAAGLVAIALVTSLSTAALFQNDVGIRAIPTAMLVRIIDVERLGSGELGRIQASLQAEYARRRASGELRRKHVEVLGQRIVATFDGSQDLVRTRAVWPTDSDVHIGLPPPRRFDLIGTVALRVVDGAGNTLGTIDRGDDSYLYRPNTVEIPASAIGSGLATIAVELVVLTEQPPIVASQTVLLRTERAPTIEDVLELQPDDLRSALPIVDIFHYVSPGQTTTQILMGLRSIDHRYAVGIWIELVEDGRVVAAVPYVVRRKSVDDRAEYESISLVVPTSGPTPRRTLRFRTDAQLALRSFEHDRAATADTLEIPLKRGQLSWPPSRSE